MNRQLFLAALTVGFSAAAMGACEEGSKTVFSCITAKSKLIQVCDSGKTINYSFGKLNSTPEIVVRVSRSEASTYQWSGVGRTIYYSVDVPNGNTTYSVFSGFDRLVDKYPFEAGVQIEVNKKHVATVKCIGEEIHVVNNIMGIDLKPSE